MNIFKRIWTWFLPDLTPEQIQAEREHRAYQRGALDFDIGRIETDAELLAYCQGWKVTRKLRDREAKIEAWLRGH